MLNTSGIVHNSNTGLKCILKIIKLAINNILPRLIVKFLRSKSNRGNINPCIRIIILQFSGHKSSIDFSIWQKPDKLYSIVGVFLKVHQVATYPYSTLTIDKNNIR